MNVFSDLHHSSLYFSLHLLLEKRLDFNLFRPVGMEWADENYWLIHKPYNYSPDTAKQYLSLDQRYKPIDGTNPLNTIIDVKPTHFEIEDKAHNFIEKAITLEQFKEMDIDIIIASIPDHWLSFKKLRDKYKPKAKLIAHVGNFFPEIEKAIQDGLISNLLASVSPFKTNRNINTCFYLQEFPLEVFYKGQLHNNRNIYSFVNCFSDASDLFKEDWKLFQNLEKIMPNYNFRSYGSQCRDGWCNGIKSLSDKMREAMFIWNTKRGGDGFGYIIFNSASIGKPLIVRKSDYKNRIGEKLMREYETCLIIDDKPLSKIKEDIEYYSVPQEYKRLCENVYSNFKNIVDYQKEEEKVKKFLENLI